MQEINMSKLYFLLAIVILPVLLICDTWYVDGSVIQSGNGTSPAEAFKTIQEAIDACNNGDEILIYEGVYCENVEIGDNNSITLRSEIVSGEYLIETTILQGDAGGGDIITIDRNTVSSAVITINGLTISHQENVLGRGVNIFSEDCAFLGTVVFNNCIISENAISDGDGGGINVNNETCASNETGGIELYNCNITNNEALNGGGMSIHNTKDNIVIAGCLFTGNSANFDTNSDLGGTGGGVRIKCIIFIYPNGGNSLTIQNSNFIDNYCDYNGGGMSIAHVSTETNIDNCVFNNNTSLIAGGLYLANLGVSNDYDLCTLSQCHFNDNSAGIEVEGAGGGMVVLDAALTVTNSEFIDNHTSGSGGGLFLKSSELEMNNSLVTQNTGSGAGGGIFLDAKSYYNGCTCNFSNLTITDNIAGYAGNRVGTTGGGIAGNKIVEFNGDNLIVNSNESQGPSAGGGGIFLDSVPGHGSVNIENSSICNNLSDGYGGGLHLTWIHTVDLDNLEVNDNAVRSVSTGITYYCDGLGLYLSSIGDGGCRVSNCQFNSNSLTILDNNPLNAHGGGVYVNRTYLIMDNCEIKNNSTFWGSGIAFGAYDDYLDAAFISNTIISGNIRHQNSPGPSGAVYILDETHPQPIEFTNCTIADNETDETGVGGIEVHGYQVSGEGVELLNCILWGNAGDQHNDLITHITYSDLEENSVTGLGNINLDPEFTNPVAEDYSLRYDSPCINTGNPSSIFNDPDGTCSDMGYKYHAHDIYDWSYDGGKRTYLWRSFPRLSLDSQVPYNNGNNLVVSEVLQNWNSFPDGIDVWYNVQPAVSGIHFQGNWTWAPVNYTINSKKGYKMSRDNGEGCVLYSRGLKCLDNVEFHTEPYQETWLGYFLKDTQLVLDAFPQEALEDAIAIHTME